MEKENKDVKKVVVAFINENILQYKK